MLQPGDSVKDTRGQQWKLKRHLGSGTCCTVYLVQLQTEETQAALKVYKQGDNYAAAHQREALLLDLLHKMAQPCPQLVKVLDNLRHGNQACLLQELLDMDLRQLVQKNQGQGLSLFIIQKLTRDMLRGLHHLHQAGFVHGDLKSTNLLWSSQDGCLKLIDFGLTFHANDQARGSLQTPSYRAPEVERWMQDKTNACPRKPIDMWSLGCIIVELHQARKMFVSKKSDAQADRKRMLPEAKSQAEVLVDQLLTLRENEKNSPLVSEVTESLKNLVKGMMDEDTSKRFTAKQALEHAFFTYQFTPSYKDLLLLPTCILRLLNMIDVAMLEDEEEYEDILADIQEECEEYGPVQKVVIPRDREAGRGKVYVQYYYPQHSAVAFEQLCGRTFSSRTVISTYFPVVDFEQQNWY